MKKIKVYTLVLADFADDYLTRAKVFSSLEDAQKAMREDYDAEMADCDLEDGECEYDHTFGDMHAAIRENVFGDYWLDWTIEEHEIEVAD